MRTITTREALRLATDSAYILLYHVGMSAAKAQYTIRGISSEVDIALRKVAKERHLSLNKYLLEQLNLIAEQATPRGPYHDLDFAIGSMTDGALVDEALESFSVIDEEMWK